MEHDVLGDPERAVGKPAAIDSSDVNSVSFCSYKADAAIDSIRLSKAGVVFCSNELSFEKNDYDDKTLVLVEDPKLAFVRIMQHFFDHKRPHGVHPSAIIENGAVIGHDVYIGPNTYIGKCKVEEDTIIYGNCYLYPDVMVGKRVLVNAGAIIGREGIGHVRDVGGKWQRFPHIGGVIIKDGAEIGGNSCIDRGTLGNTVIGEGTIVNNLCHIGHNVVVGKDCLIGVGSILCGGSKVGNRCWLGPGSIVRDGVTIGEKAVIGMGSVVTKNVPDNCVVYGIPARIIKKSHDSNEF